jgi:large subunit ribosomal protein L24
MAKQLRIRTGDHVTVRSGKDRGKSGRVLRTDPKRRFLYIEGLNMVKRHERPRSVQDASRGGEVGGIVDQEGPIHASNVMLLDPKDNKPTRVGVRRDGGKRERYSKRTGEALD